MNNIEKQYLDILYELLTHGVRKENRTGIDTFALFSRRIRHDMRDGFPLLTTRRLPIKSTWVELEGFIKGITSKKWYEERGCKFWSWWCNPQKIKYSNDEETKSKMRSENDLGEIYGAQWRRFRDPKFSDIDNLGVDQLENIVSILKTNPNDRRMICLAWNPLALEHQALPACHLGFVVNILNGKLNLEWWQRSCDWICGVPQNITSYATLLHLLAKESGFEEGELVGNFVDVHIYENHIDGAKEQMDRKILDLPDITTNNFKSIFDWENGNSELKNYNFHPKIKFDVAI